LLFRCLGLLGLELCLCSKSQGFGLILGRENTSLVNFLESDGKLKVSLRILSHNVVLHVLDMFAVATISLFVEKVQMVVFVDVDLLDFSKVASENQDDGRALVVTLLQSKASGYVEIVSKVNSFAIHSSIHFSSDEPFVFDSRNNGGFACAMIKSYPLITAELLDFGPRLVKQIFFRILKHVNVFIEMACEELEKI